MPTPGAPASAQPDGHGITYFPGTINWMKRRRSPRIAECHESFALVRSG